MFYEECAVCGCCSHCGEDIVEGDDIFILDDGHKYHEDCFYDVAVRILLERGIAETAVAESEHPEWDLETDLAKEERKVIA